MGASIDDDHLFRLMGPGGERWPVDTAVRSEQLTVCRVRYGSELYGKIIRIDDDPPTLFVGVPARTGQEGDRGYVGRAGLVGVSDLATYTVRPAEPSRVTWGIASAGSDPLDTQRPSNWIAPRGLVDFGSVVVHT